jgi:S1-C subfamily serine protease
MRFVLSLIALLLLAVPAFAQSNKPWLGVAVEVVDGADAEKIGIAGGLKVTRVVASSPADMAGLLVGDIILTAGESAVTSIEKMGEVMGQLRPGDFLALGVRRESGATEPVIVTLASTDERGEEHADDERLRDLREELRRLDVERRRIVDQIEQYLKERQGRPAPEAATPQPEEAAPEVHPPQRAQLRVSIGAGLLSLSLQDAQRLNVEGGVVVTRVHESSAAEEAGLQVNDVITHLNDEKVIGTGGLRTLLTRFEPGDRVVLQVLRNGEHMTLTLKLAPTRE